MRKGSPYGLDFFTAVVIYRFHEHWTDEEIEAELNRRLAPFPYTGPRVKTIRRWLDIFGGAAEAHTSFFIKQLLEQGFHVPTRKGLTQQAYDPEYASLYFLECLCSLYGQLHPKAKNDFRFLWYANQLVRARLRSELFRSRPP